MSANGFPRDLFDDVVETLGGGIDFVSDEGKPSLRIHRKPPRVEIRQGTCAVTFTLDDTELRSTARTDEEHAFVERMIPLLRESVAQARVHKAERVAAFERHPLHASPTFGRVEFDALIKSLGTVADMADLRLGDATASVARGWWDRAARIELKRGGQEVTILSLDTTLRTTAATDADRAFVDEIGARIQPAVEELARRREHEIEAAIASSPTVDRDTLVEALAALTHGRVDVQPIADAILPATTDPRRYVADNARRLRSFGIDAPTEGLHTVALLSHIPRAHLAYFDWKDSMHTMVETISAVLRAGPGVGLDVERFRARCDKWDRSRDRIPALKEVAAEIPDAALVELKQDGDAYAIACVPMESLAKLRSWNTKAHVGLRSLAPSTRAKPGTKALEKTLAQATGVKTYAATARFATGDIVEHPTFGRGQVVGVTDNKVVLKFRDAERTLVHGKT